MWRADPAAHPGVLLVALPPNSLPPAAAAAAVEEDEGEEQLPAAPRTKASDGKQWDSDGYQGQGFHSQLAAAPESCD